MSNTALRTSILATDYDGAVYAAGQPIYSSITVGGKNVVRVLPLPGQVVFYNPATGLATGEAATKSTVPLLKVGVAYANDGNPNVADDIWWFNDGMNGCSMQDMAGRAPACGITSIWDAHFTCIECNQAYTIEVIVTDPFTEAFGNPEVAKDFIYHFTYFYPCGDCSTGDCAESTPNADEVMCGLYNKIKGIHHDPNWDITLNDFPLEGDHEYRFDVAMLYDGDAPELTDETTYEYCITQSDSDCVDCVNFTAIGGYSLTGSVDETFDIPTTTSDGEGGFFSTRSQIELAVAQLNAGLEGNGGSAVFLPAAGNCCTNHKIEVNTCLLNFELHNAAGVAIEPCQKSNPFSATTIYSQCQDCDSNNSTLTPRNGLRFYAKQVEGECSCIPGNKALVEYFAEIRVAFKRGWDLRGVRSFARQYATLPKGQGFQWQSRQIAEHRHAFNPDFVVNNWGGKYGHPEPNDILNQIKVNCKESYCVIGGTYAGKTEHSPIGHVNFAVQDIYLLVPNDHATAKTSILAAINNYFAGGDCGIPTITCAAY